MDSREFHTEACEWRIYDNDRDLTQLLVKITASRNIWNDEPKVTYRVQPQGPFTENDKTSKYALSKTFTQLPDAYVFAIELATKLRDFNQQLNELHAARVALSDFIQPRIF